LGTAEVAAPNERVISFGPFCLQPKAHLLLEGDRPVHLGARALDVLILLIERAGELVTKEELFARVWPGLVVDEGNIRAQVALLRKGLRDGQDGARYLMTVPGRGYRFVAPMSIAEAPGSIGPKALPLNPATPDLPARLTRLIGREDAVNDITGRLARQRFVAIVGPGGIGKTSVALAVAEQARASYDDGVCLVDCAPLLGTSLVAQKLASALALEIGEDDPSRGLVAFLRSRRMLIILDCCERVLEAAAVLVENLLKGAAGVSILATSREPLRAEGESVYRLAPLEVPPAANGSSAADALTYSSVQLFVERVSASLGRFELSDTDAPVVADICRRLDGVALAIELAAGRVEVFGVPGVAARLEDRMRLLRRGRRTALPRHQTLTATLDWSYDALADSEQAALRRLSVFAGGFTLEAAQAVATGAAIVSSEVVEAIASLVSKSLLSADVTTEIGRYRLLDTTRAYALTKLTESGELEQTARRHASHIRHLLERASVDAATTSSMATRLSAESRLVDEARTVIHWAFSNGGDVESGLAVTVASIPIWTHLSLNGECCRYAERALLAGQEHFGPNDRRKMQLLAALGAALVWTKGPGPEADAAFEDALRIAESLDDADYQIRALWGLWSSHFNSSRIRLSLETARKFREVAENHGDTTAALVGERTIGMSLFYLGDHTNSRRHAESMLRRYSRPRDRSDITRFQFDPRVVSRTLLSKLLWAQGFPDQALLEAQSAVEEATAIGHGMSLALTLAQGACHVSLLSGDLVAAERSIDLLLKHTLDHALDLWHAWGACFGATLLIARGNNDEGLKKLQRILDEVPKGAFFAHHALTQATLAEALGKVGALSRAHAIIDQALMRSERDDERWYLAEFLRIKGELLQREDTPKAMQAAAGQFQRSLECARQQATLSWELRTAISLSRLHQARGQFSQARDALAPIYSRFKEGFQTTDLKTARALLEALP
jgi:predicted ATPase/DNA-binding winged helix-turn-helix (wHTH) protein